MQDFGLGRGNEFTGSSREDEEVSFFKGLTIDVSEFAGDDGDDGKAVVFVRDLISALEVKLIDDEVVAGCQGVAIRLVHAWFEVVEIDGGE